MVTETRLYSFVNMYLSDIQKGIQTAHIVGELSMRSHPQYDDWLDWKTIIVLNGGNAQSLWDIRNFLQGQKDYVNTHFCEDDQSLGGSITAVGIILPEKVYTGKGKGRTKLDKKLYKFLQEYHLA